jgi:hypothetical protein
MAHSNGRGWLCPAARRMVHQLTAARGCGPALRGAGRPCRAPGPRVAVDSAYQKLTGFVEDFVTEPTTMPWGNRSLLFRDPDGNLVNFFTPVTPAAIEKFAR